MFHAPEDARNTTHPTLRTTRADGNNGLFDLASPEPGWRLAIICSDSTDPDSAQYSLWEHVSVHAYADGLPGRRVKLRTPTWKEMCFVKDMWWDGEDVVMQLHPRRSEYVNQHQHTLHLWAPIDAVIPTPPSIFVGMTSPSATSDVGNPAEERREKPAGRTGAASCHFSISAQGKA